MRRMWLISCGFAALSACGIARADTIANSVSDFSGVQGQGGWYYGYETTLGGSIDTSPTDFAYNGSAWARTPTSAPPWTYIGPVFMHPNGTNSAPYEVEYATRRFDYTGPTEANVQITGHFSKFNDPSATVGDGVDGYILLNGVTIDTFYSNSVTNQFTTPLNIPALQSGDVLDFVVGPGPHGNDGADHTDYEVNIATSAPLPSTALGGFALLGGLIGWRLRRRAQARP